MRFNNTPQFQIPWNRLVVLKLHMQKMDIRLTWLKLIGMYKIYNFVNPIRKGKESLENLYIKEQYIQEVVELCHRSKHGRWLASHTQAQAINSTVYHAHSYINFQFSCILCSVLLTLSLNGAFQNVPSEICVILLVVQYSTVLCFCLTSLYLYLSTQPYIFTRNAFQCTSCTQDSV